MDVVDPTDAIITVGGNGTVSEVNTIYHRSVIVCLLCMCESPKKNGNIAVFVSCQ